MRALMIYRVHFVDHGGGTYDTVLVEHDDDEAAIREVHRINVPGIGAGFDETANSTTRWTAGDADHQ
jgi:hypothetical protein